MTTTHVAAADIGSSSGRVILGTLDGDGLSLIEVHRFPHRTVSRQGVLCWDLEALVGGIQDGIEAARVRAGGRLEGVAVDTWGVDYVLHDRSGEAILPARSYRDPRTTRIVHPITSPKGRLRLWQHTGVQPDPINTTHQLVADLAEHPDLMDRVDSVLLLADHFAFRLSGERGWSRSACSTSGLCRQRVGERPAGEWSPEVLGEIGADPSWFGPISAERTVVAPMRSAPGTLVLRAGGHDTACAVHALGTDAQDEVFISSGSWSLIGVQRDRPLLSQEAFAAGFTNEARTDGGIRTLKNLTGLWILQECQRVWQRDGQEADISRLLARARDAAPLGAVFDPNHDDFRHPGEMPDIVSEHLRRHHGVTPAGTGQLVRTVLESLAAAYADAVAEIGALAGISPRAVHLVGGGARNELLCQMTAAATGLPVHIGPAESSAAGNIAAQLEALGRIEGPSARRDLLRTPGAGQEITYPAGMDEYFTRIRTRSGAHGAGDDEERDVD